ncbi:MAG TPA: hemerythrin domain-containing protein [Candidatus Obscuribacterales bacterium]
MNNTFERDEALRPMSRDHGVLLVIAQRLRKAAAGTENDRQVLTGELRETFGALIEEYLSDEEDALTSIAMDEDVRKEMLLEHAIIRVALKRLINCINADFSQYHFSGLSDSIEDHVRWDEEAMFPYIQRELSSEERKTLAGATAVLELRHCRPTQRLRSSVELHKAAGKAETCTCANCAGL